MVYSITVSKLIEKMNLKNYTPEIDTDKVLIQDPGMNRPAVQFGGFFEHFDAGRIQICGNVEHAYIAAMHTEEENIKIINEFFSYKPPCLIFCRDLEPYEFIIEAGKKHGVPVLTSSAVTSAFVHEVDRWLHVELAPRISVHAVLVDVYGEGVLIMGESGIGKSEAALELIKRGHRLVADDVVEIKKVSDATLVGRAPDITRHFIELRGIGIIDVKSLFGVECVKLDQNIDLVINPGMRQSRKHGVDKKRHLGKQKGVDAVQAELMEHYQDYMEEFADELSAFGVVQEMEKDREMLEDEQ